MDDASADLLARWLNGDQRAAEELVGKYTERLLALARSHLSAKLVARIDPEDVLQSAYRSFFAKAEHAGMVLERSGDLWRLLAAITMHKLQHQVARHRAGKRSVEKEQRFGSESSLFLLNPRIVARETPPLEVMAAVEELEVLLCRLRPLHRRMVELRLQGHRIGEIAADTERSERFVRKVLGQVKTWLIDRHREVAQV